MDYGQCPKGMSISIDKISRWDESEYDFETLLGWKWVRWAWARPVSSPRCAALRIDLWPKIWENLVFFHFVTESTLKYLSLSQPDWMTVCRDSNFYSLFSSCWATLAFVNVNISGCKILGTIIFQTFYLLLLVLAWHYLQHWDKPPQSGIPDVKDYTQSPFLVVPNICTNETFCSTKIILQTLLLK